jgi:hypothetical protein
MTDLADRIRRRLANEAEGNVYLDISWVMSVIAEEDAATPAPLDVAWMTAIAALPSDSWEITLARSFYRGGFVAYAALSMLAPDHVSGTMVESAPFPGSHPTAVDALNALTAAIAAAYAEEAE